LNESLPAAQLDIGEETALNLAEIFRALSDPSRVRILSILLEQEQNVNTLAEAVGISESAVSHHLRGLRQLHIVRARRQGREVFYSLDDDHVTELLQKGLDHVRHD
jgi:DNA-binding transcriptional ArsR family regulator